MKTIIELEKEIDKIREGCGKELGEDYQELCCGEDFDNEESKTGASFILCQDCREKFFKLESKLQTLKEVLELIDDFNWFDDDAEWEDILGRFKRLLSEEKRGGD